jgi:hypothetical protein
MKFFLKVKGDVFQFRNLIRLKIVSYVFNGNKLVFKLIELLYVFLNCRYYLLIKENIYVARPYLEFVNGRYFSENTNHLFNREVTIDNADVVGNVADLNSQLVRLSFKKAIN